MNHPIAEREYPYRHHLVSVSLVFLLFSSGALFSLWYAVTDHRDIIINGIIPLRGGAASIFRWSVFATMAAMAVISGRFIWIRVVYPGHRIAFTSTGILLPRNRWTAMEEFVRYGDISGVSLENIENLGVSAVTFLRFRCPKGTFAISRQKLKKDDFVEVCAMLLQKCQEAKESSPAIPSSSGH